MNPYRQPSVPPDRCPDCLHTWGAHNPSRETMDAYCVSIGQPKLSRIKPPRCHVVGCRCKSAR